jgi:hypothetical protein
MMIGVPQVIGIKPTLRSFFSMAPPLAKTSVAVFSGKNCDSAASAVEAPSDCRKARRPRSCGEKRAHDRRSDHVLVTLFVAFNREASQLRAVPFMLGLTGMAAARAAAAVQ